MGRLKQLWKRARHRHTKECSTDKCLEKADEKLHEQASRLHVLEWEAYGHPKRPKPKGHY